MISSNWSYNDKGILVINDKSDYIDENGVKVIRLKIKNNKSYSYRFKTFDNLYKTIEIERPDILFIHGFQWVYIRDIVRYKKKHLEVRIYVDNHADYTNSASNWISKNILHGIIWRYYANMIEPYAEKFYGVLPARVDILTDLYKLPASKCELLVMGADDEKVKEAETPEINKIIRKKYDIEEDDFLIITGGKIDLFKQQTLLLMDAVNRINDPKVKLIVFGSVVNELKKEVNNRCSDKVKYIGWVQSDESYKYFAASDLAVFPGRHSVFWEQVTGQGIPMIVKHWEGTTHVDLSGNVKFLYDDSETEIEQALRAVVYDKDVYDSMKQVAKQKGKDVFSYYNIAKRSIKDS